MFQKRFGGGRTPEDAQNQGQVPGFGHRPDGFSEEAVGRTKGNFKG